MDRQVGKQNMYVLLVYHMLDAVLIAKGFIFSASLYSAEKDRR